MSKANQTGKLTSTFKVVCLVVCIKHARRRRRRRHMQSGARSLAHRDSLGRALLARASCLHLFARMLARSSLTRLHAAAAAYKSVVHRDAMRVSHWCSNGSILLSTTTTTTTQRRQLPVKFVEQICRVQTLSCWLGCIDTNLIIAALARAL